MLGFGGPTPTGGGVCKSRHLAGWLALRLNTIRAALKPPLSLGINRGRTC
jgi:hypothetical protein